MRSSAFGSVYRDYIQLGTVDEILRRSFRERMDLAGYQYEEDRALALSMPCGVSEAPQMLPQAQQALALA